MKARELLKTDVKVGTLVDINGIKGMVIGGFGVKGEKVNVINDKSIILLYIAGDILMCDIIGNSLDKEAKIIKRVVLG